MMRRCAIEAGTGIAVALSFALCGCSGTSNDQTTKLETELANDSTDSLVRETLAGPLITDPDLARAANINAVRSGEGMPGNAMPLPLRTGDQATMPPFPSVGRIAAPAPAAAAPCPDCEADGPVTLGALAREQAARVSGTCRVNADYRLNYGMQWAEQLPAPFALYRGAAVMDAAGADVPGCTLRAASIVTAASLRDITDFYYTLASKAGLAPRHQTLRNRALLMGTRGPDRLAFLMFLGAEPGGGTRVDLVVTQRR